MQKSSIQTDFASLVLRVIFGLFMLFGHGWMKVMKVINGDWKFASVLGMGEEVSLLSAVFAEAICSILLIIGFKTRIAATILLVTMLIAGFVIHSEAPLFIANAEGGGSKELALMYGSVFLTLIFLGGRKFSIDGILKS
ncbi:DoxX family protein [Membranihabitans maritimus]|uniref:DoxX family protein n=1 Tax=Membranihabitans maritimus TaxID=2904244 RepID=UPI001F35A1FF|nr:DoxX family protein [Membranihabitans maritimus]